jgi:CheY-specific phosphatase CheX
MVTAARFYRDQSGEGLISGLYTMMVLVVILFLAVEIAAYGMLVWKLYGACDEIMDMMKAENGLDAAMRQRFRELTAALHLEELDLRLDGTPPTVQRGDLLELKAQGQYKIRSMRPLGREFSVPVSVRLHGLAHTYIRRF